MLANDWIKLFDFHFVRHGALVFCGGIEMACTSRRYQLNLISHGLYLLALCAKISNNLIDSTLVDDAHTLSRNSKLHKSVLAF